MDLNLNVRLHIIIYGERGSYTIVLSSQILFAKMTFCSTLCTSSLTELLWSGDVK